MRQRKLSKSWRNIFKKFLLPTLALATLILILFLPGRMIKVNKIQCETQYGECPEDINSEFKTISTKQLSNSKNQIQNILKENKLVSDYSIQYIFPDQLKVNILLRKARYAILNKDTGKYLLLDSGGRVLGFTESTSLPVVEQSGDAPNLFALSLIEGVFAMYQVGKGEIIGDGLVVDLPGSVRVIFPLDKSQNKDILLGSLRLIYDKISGSPEVSVREIDLRFKNPILR